MDRTTRLPFRLPQIMDNDSEKTRLGIHAYADVSEQVTPVFCTVRLVGHLPAICYT